MLGICLDPVLITRMFDFRRVASQIPQTKIRFFFDKFTLLLLKNWIGLSLKFSLFFLSFMFKKRLKAVTRSKTQLYLMKSRSTLGLWVQSSCALCCLFSAISGDWMHQSNWWTNQEPLTTHRRKKTQSNSHVSQDQSHVKESGGLLKQVKRKQPSSDNRLRNLPYCQFCFNLEHSRLKPPPRF